VDLKFPEYEPEKGVVGFMSDYMVWSNRNRYNEIYMKIRDRYNFENRWREHYSDNYREDYTPKQKRRIRKQTNKYRRRYLEK
jgi:hypothetical protein